MKAQSTLCKLPYNNFYYYWDDVFMSLERDTNEVLDELTERCYYE